MDWCTWNNWWQTWWDVFSYWAYMYVYTCNSYLTTIHWSWHSVHDPNKVDHFTFLLPYTSREGSLYEFTFLLCIKLNPFKLTPDVLSYIRFKSLEPLINKPLVTGNQKLGCSVHTPFTPTSDAFQKCLLNASPASNVYECIGEFTEPWYNLHSLVREMPDQFIGQSPV